MIGYYITLLRLIMLLTLLSFSGISVCSGKSAKILQAKVFHAEYPATLSVKAEKALAFCRLKHFNTSFCILIDLSIHSGLRRFFVWDLKRHAVIQNSLVSHGCGDSPWSWTWSKEKAVFSNVDGSHCSSLGKYRIGRCGYSNWGINVNYKMHGLDKTNSNAFARQIVLHSWEKVPEKEVYPAGTPEGWGCPAVSNSMMKLLDKKISKSHKPILLWIYN